MHPGHMAGVPSLVSIMRRCLCAQQAQGEIALNVCLPLWTKLPSLDFGVVRMGQHLLQFFTVQW